MSRQATLVDFFEQYAATSMGAKPQDLAAFYDTSFLAAGPQGSAAFQNDEAFRGWLQQARDFNETSGMTGLEVVAVRETPVSREYVLASVRWGARFRKTGDELIEFGISYLLRLEGDSFKVAAYVSHEDQEAAMRERGLL